MPTRLLSYVNLLTANIELQGRTRQQKNVLRGVAAAILCMYESINERYLHTKSVNINLWDKKMKGLVRKVSFNKAFQDIMEKWWAKLRDKLQQLNEAIQSGNYGVDSIFYDDTFMPKTINAFNNPYWVDY